MSESKVGLNRWAKAGIVLGGYALAVVAATVVTALYDRRFTPQDNQQMGGMIAGGEMMLATGVFLFISLFPTGLALWWVRRHRPSWSVFSILCLAFAIVGLFAALTFLVTRGGTPKEPALMVLDLLGLAQMLGAPVWIVGFGLFALLAPARDLRRRLLVAAAFELAVGGCAVLHFLPAYTPF